MLLQNTETEVYYRDNTIESNDNTSTVVLNLKLHLDVIKLKQFNVIETSIRLLLLVVTSLRKKAITCEVVNDELLWIEALTQATIKGSLSEGSNSGLGKLSDPGKKTGVVTYILYGQLVFILIEKKKKTGQARS